MSAENRLFPVFLKINKFNTLVVGGGNVGLEKLNALLKNDPAAKVTLVGRQVADAIKERVRGTAVVVHERAFQEKDLEAVQLLILATDDRSTNEYIYKLANARGILTNVADTPDLCDFYLGSTVTRGNLKVGISTNGLSPTFAKRFREVLEDILPEETDELIRNLNKIRNELKGSFAEKIKILNAKTKGLVSGK